MSSFNKLSIGCRGWAACVFIASFPACALAATPRSSLDEIFDSLNSVQDFREVSISPDGRRVAWVEQLREPGGTGSSCSAIFVTTLPAALSRPRRITAVDGGGGCEEHDVAWSPDGRNLAFLSDAKTPRQLQLFMAPAAGGPARKLTGLQGFLTVPRFSPDGRTIALLFTEKTPRVIGPLLPVAPPAGVVGSDVYEQRLTTVELGSGRVQQLSPADMYVYEYDWSPDSKRFASIAARGESDSNWYLAQLYVLDTASREMKSIYKPPLQIGTPRWSLDGRSVAFIGGIMSDEGRTGGDIFLVSADGGEARNLTPGMKATANWLSWKSDGRELFFYEDLAGATGVASLEIVSGRVTTLWSGQETLADVPGIGTRNIAFSLSADGKTAALVREFYNMPPEVWAGPVGAWKQITRLNSGVRPILGKVESIEWPNEGLRIQGWLAYPRDYDPARRYPMIVQVHGGPSSVSRIRWFFDLTVFAHEGYFVFLPNPRGSFGRGEDFTRGNVKDFGYGDFRDIQSGVDYVVKNYPVDGNRIGISGWSYGGYLTMWAVTQTNRFRAAVAGAGIANWQSYYGENDIDQWLIPFFGASVYDDPAIYARSSPINFIKNVQTPTLILAGERDGECPIPQSYEFWHALKTLGVDTQLVIYAGEGHRMTKPQDQRDVIERTLNWFNRYLQAR
jgi:dipeptidyl aminopeptidase/acylaminoacyl peptidase